MRVIGMSLAAEYRQTYIDPETGWKRSESALASVSEYRPMGLDEVSRLVDERYAELGNFVESEVIARIPKR